MQIQCAERLVYSGISKGMVRCSETWMNSKPAAVQVQCAERLLYSGNIREGTHTALLHSMLV